jgi:hypothetical protein
MEYEAVDAPSIRVDLFQDPTGMSFIPLPDYHCAVEGKGGNVRAVVAAFMNRAVPSQKMGGSGLRSEQHTERVLVKYTTSRALLASSSIRRGSECVGDARRWH